MKWYKALHIVVITLAVSTTLFIGYSNYFTYEYGEYHEPIVDSSEVESIPKGGSSKVEPPYSQSDPPRVEYVEEPTSNNLTDRILKLVETFTPLAVPFITHYLYRRKERDDENSNT